jgi:type I restriction enzyme S subunit
MSSQWPVKTLEEIQSSSGRAFAIGPFGSRMKSDTYVAKGVRVVRGTNIGDSRALKGDFVYITEELASQLESCRISPGDQFFPHRGSIGEVGIIDWDDEGRYILSSSLMKFACNLKLADPRFLYYYFRTAEGKNEILRFASTVGTPGIGQPLSSLRQMRVPAPPVELQSKITDVLCSLDDKIELNRRMNTTLESMAQAIFKS